MHRYLLALVTHCWISISLPALAEAPKATALSQNDLPPGMHVLGTFVSALRWSDKTGDHVAAFSRKFDQDKGEARLQVELWSGKGTEGTIVRTIKDGESHCDFDLYAEFIAEALSVTDLDDDGLGELTFAYRTTCTSDVSPFKLKLLLLEQRTKFAVRGSTLMDVGNGEKAGGEKKVEPALKKQPAFLRHLEAVWAKIVGLNPWT